jgi:hypothetical protein
MKIITSGPPTGGHRHHRNHRSSDFAAGDNQSEDPSDTPEQEPTTEVIVATNHHSTAPSLPRKPPHGNHASPAGQLPTAMPCASSPPSGAEGSKIQEACSEARRSRRRLHSGASKKKATPIGAAAAGRQEPGRAFVRSFWTATSRNRPKPARATTEPHTPNAATAPTPRQATTNLETRPGRPDPATSSSSEATMGAKRSGRCRKAPPPEPGGRAATPPCRAGRAVERSRCRLEGGG